MHVAAWLLKKVWRPGFYPLDGLVATPPSLSQLAAPAPLYVVLTHTRASHGFAADWPYSDSNPRPPQALLSVAQQRLGASPHIYSGQQCAEAGTPEPRAARTQAL